MQSRDLHSPQAVPPWLPVAGAFALMMVLACAVCVSGTAAMLAMSESLEQASRGRAGGPDATAIGSGPGQVHAARPARGGGQTGIAPDRPVLTSEREFRSIRDRE